MSFEHEYFNLICVSFITSLLYILQIFHYRVEILLYFLPAVKVNDLYLKIEQHVRNFLKNKYDFNFTIYRRRRVISLVSFLDNTKSGTIQKSEESDDDVIIISETKVSAEEEKKALYLQLPKNFYAYLQKPPCPGCIGCNPDDFVFETPKKISTASTKTPVTTSKSEILIPTPKAATIATSQSTVTFGETKSTPTEYKSPFNPFGGSKTPVTFSFLSPTVSSPTVSTNKSPLAAPKLNASGSIFSSTESTTPKNIFSGSNIFGNVSKPGSESSLFGFAKADTPKTATLFGNSPDLTPKTSLFGLNKDAPKTESIFGGKVEPKASTEMIFGQKGNVFGEANMFGTPKTEGSSTTSIFGSQVKTDDKTIFGSPAVPSFGSLAQENVSFAALAGENQTFIQTGMYVFFNGRE